MHGGWVGGLVGEEGLEGGGNRSTDILFLFLPFIPKLVCVRVSACECVWREPLMQPKKTPPAAISVV